MKAEPKSILLSEQEISEVTYDLFYMHITIAKIQVLKLFMKPFAVNKKRGAFDAVS